MRDSLANRAKLFRGKEVNGSRVITRYRCAYVSTQTPIVCDGHGIFDEKTATGLSAATKGPRPLRRGDAAALQHTGMVGGLALAVSTTR